jgi:hypothetical protein
MISPAFVELSERDLSMSIPVAAGLGRSGVETIEFGKVLLGDSEPAVAIAPGFHWSEDTTRRAAVEIATRVGVSR